MNKETNEHETGLERSRELFLGRFPATLRDYHRLYHESTQYREEYWKSQSERLRWAVPFSRVVDEDFSHGKTTWFPDGRLNAASNALDRNIESDRADKPALIYTVHGQTDTSISYRDLADKVHAAANALAGSGLKAGDRAALYLPDRPETVIAMLACSLLGIIYVPIPYTFTTEITAEIIRDCGASLLIVSGSSLSKTYLDRARQVAGASSGISVVTVDGVGDVSLSWNDFLKKGADGKAESDDYASTHPLFIAYANSATGIPRGSVFAVGGYLVQAALSYDTIFRSLPAGDNSEAIVCTLSLASAAGQSYGLWGPMLNGSAVIITAEGENSCAESLKGILDGFDAPALLTTPLMLTTLKRELNDNRLAGERGFSIVACCGDVLTPRLVRFAGQTLSVNADRVINLWIQSESGTAIINDYPSPELNRPGALGLPAFGITPSALNTMGIKCRTNESGQLVFSSSWPGMVTTIWGQPDRFKELYFNRIPDHFMTNDAVRVDAEGFYWFMGRLDDVVKVRGQSLATSEIEAVIVGHSSISEAAVVSVPGEENDNLIAFISLEHKIVDSVNNAMSKKIEAELSDIIIARIGEFALPNKYVFARELPKTRTGKLVRRVLRRIASGDIAHDEDLSHVANPEAVKDLVERKNDA